MLKGLFEKILRLKEKQILKVFSFTAISTIVKMLTNLVSVKVLAVYVGPAGVALLGQLSNFSNIVLTVGSGGINGGVTKYIAEYRNSPDKIKSLLSTSTKITFSLSILIGALLIIFSKYLATLILNSTEHRLIFIVFGLTLCLYSLNNQLLAILNGFKEYKKYVIINITASIIGLFFTVTLVLLYGIKGALISAVSYQSITFFISLFFVLKSPWFKKDYFIGRFNYYFSKKLFQYSLMTIVSAFTVPVSQIVVRNYITNSISLNAAGIWEGINRISGMYLMLITSSLAIYYLPRLSEIKRKEELRNEIFNVYKFLIPVVIFSILLIFISKNYIINLVFSKEFSTMESLFKFQLIGDFFKINAWILSFIMIAKAKTKLFITTEIVFSATFITLSFILVNKIGLEGAAMAYMVNYLIYFIVMLIIFKKLLFKNAQ
jgi:O-antigen/teichoic acid export membrane protein